MGLWGRIERERYGAVVVVSTDSYFEPILKSTIHFHLPEGTRVKVLNKEEEWLKIKRGDGKLGWVKKETLERI